MPTDGGHGASALLPAYERLRPNSPTTCELRRLARNQNLDAVVRQSSPTGKSLLGFGNRVKPNNQKYFAFPEGQIRAHLSPSRPDKRGVS